jgi:hypothetical protein
MIKRVPRIRSIPNARFRKNIFLCVRRFDFKGQPHRDSSWKYVIKNKVESKGLREKLTPFILAVAH